MTITPCFKLGASTEEVTQVVKPPIFQQDSHNPAACHTEQQGAGGVCVTHQLTVQRNLSP